jgi:hypothetical protein
VRTTTAWHARARRFEKPSHLPRSLCAACAEPTLRVLYGTIRVHYALGVPKGFSGGTRSQSAASHRACGATPSLARPAAALKWSDRRLRVTHLAAVHGPTSQLRRRKSRTNERRRCEGHCRRTRSLGRLWALWATARWRLCYCYCALGARAAGRRPCKAARRPVRRPAQTRTHAGGDRARGQIRPGCMRSVLSVHTSHSPHGCAHSTSVLEHPSLRRRLRAVITGAVRHRAIYRPTLTPHTQAAAGALEGLGAVNAARRQRTNERAERSLRQHLLRERCPLAHARRGLAVVFSKRHPLAIGDAAVHERHSVPRCPTEAAATRQPVPLLEAAVPNGSSASG